MKKTWMRAWLVMVLGCSIAIHAEDKLIPSGRAEEQYRKADVVLYFEGVEDILIERPEGHREPFKLAALAEKTAKATSNRRLAVVIMGKVTRLWPDEKFKLTVDDLEARLKGLGFEKVAVHLASGTLPTPIYRES